VTFPEAAIAQKGASAIKALQAERRIKIYWARIVARGPRGELTVREITRRAHGSASAGALIGGLAGFALDPLAMIIGAAGGALIGHAANVLHEGEAVKLLRRTSDKLAPGKAVALVEISEGDFMEFARLMEPFGTAILRN
jgi:uncharacterized membrane protein